MSSTPLLDSIRTSADVRALKDESLRQLADEVRRDLIDIVSVTGGHFGAGLKRAGQGRHPHVHPRLRDIRRRIHRNPHR